MSDRQSQQDLRGPGTRLAIIAVPGSILGILFSLMADSELLAYRIAVSGAVVALMGILADRILLGLIDFAKSYGKHLLQWIIVGLGALGTLVLFAYITVFIAIELAEVAL